MKKKLILIYIFLAAIFLVSCGQNIDDTEVVQSEYMDTENLIIRVVNIYDTPQGHWNYTVSACGMDTDCTEV